MFSLNNLNNLNNLGVATGGSLWYKSSNLALNGVAPTLIYKFDSQQYYTGGVGSSGIPFSPTRTTNATQINSAGNMIFAQANMYSRSDVGDAGWTASSSVLTLASSIQSPTATSTRKLVANNTITVNGNDSVGGIVAPTVTTMAGATYAISFYAKAAEISSVRVRESTATGTRATIDLTTGVVAYESGSSSLTNMVVTATDVGDNWWRIICKRTVSGTSQGFNIKQGGTTGDGASGIYVTSAQFELDDTTAPKPYTATAGAAYYAHRFDYNPLTLASRGILCEYSATNLAPNSRNAAYVGDTGFGTSSAAPTALLGFGGTRFTANGTANSHYITTPSTAVAPSASTVYTLSAYVKAGTTTLVQLTTSSGFAAADVYANFDLSTGSAGSAGAGASNVTIIDNGNDVYRIALTFTTIGVPSAGVAVIVGAISATTDTRLPSFTTSGTFDVMGLQLETGVAYTSLIPTYGVSATRSAETFNSAVGISGWFDNTKGVMYVEYEITALANRVDHVFLISKTNFTPGTEYMGFLSGYGTPGVRRFDTYVAATTYASSFVDDVTNATHKVAGRYTASTTTIKGFKNGASAGTNSAAPIPTSLDRFILSAGYGSESGIWIKAIRYYPDDSASDAQMLTLTA